MGKINKEKHLPPKEQVQKEKIDFEKGGQAAEISDNITDNKNDLSGNDLAENSASANDGESGENAEAAIAETEPKGKRAFWQAFKVAFPRTIPVLTGYIVLGMAYGVLMETKGYGAGWSVLISMLVFGGSIQYAAITLFTAAFNPLQAFLLSLMVNARHLFYGISMLQKYRGLGKLRPFLIFMLTDETYSIASGIEPPPGISRKYFYGIFSFMDYFYWVLGTFLGGVLGNFITFNTTGLDFVLTGLFVVLFIEQMKSRTGVISGIIGLGCTAFTLVVFGADNLVIIAMVLILLVLLIGRKKLCQ